MTYVMKKERRLGQHQRAILAYLYGHPGATMLEIANDVQFPHGFSTRWTNAVLWRLLRRDKISRRKFGRKYYYYAKG